MGNFIETTVFLSQKLSYKWSCYRFIYIFFNQACCSISRKFSLSLVSLWNNLSVISMCHWSLIIIKWCNYCSDFWVSLTVGGSRVRSSVQLQFKRLCHLPCHIQKHLSMVLKHSSESAGECSSCHPSRPHLNNDDILYVIKTLGCCNLPHCIGRCLHMELSKVVLYYTYLMSHYTRGLGDC